MAILYEGACMCKVQIYPNPADVRKHVKPIVTARLTVAHEAKRIVALAMHPVLNTHSTTGMTKE